MFPLHPFQCLSCRFIFVITCFKAKLSLATVSCARQMIVAKMLRAKIPDTFFTLQPFPRVLDFSYVAPSLISPLSQRAGEVESMLRALSSLDTL